MRRRDWVPAGDLELDEWMGRLVAELGTRAALLDVAPAELAALAAARDAYASARQQRVDAMIAQQSAVREKEQARTALVEMLRPIVRRLQAHPVMDDPLRHELGLHVRRRGAMDVQTMPPPMVQVDFGQRGRVLVHFGPRPNRRNRNALPIGVAGAVVQFSQGDNPPPLEGEWRWLPTALRSPLVHKVPIRRSHLWYRVAYTDRRGRTGPWSATVGTC